MALAFALVWKELLPFVKQEIDKNLNLDEFEASLKSYIKIKLPSCGFRERLDLRNDVKDNAKAAQLRCDGNKMFHARVKRYIEAIKLYNAAIKISKKGSEERALAYGMRSEICLQMQRYEECLENIRLARESNHPEGMKEKLDKRERIAKTALEKMADEPTTSSKGSSEAVEKLKLSYPSHKNAPQIANCLELHKNNQYGRHVVTNRKLNVGDVVMIDKPFASVLDEQQRCVRCDFCHEDRLFTLIPCEGCSGAMYCSEECLNKAYNQYHRYECGLVRNLWKIGDVTPRIVFRTLATTIGIFDNDPEALKEYLDSFDEANVNSFTMNWESATPKDVFGVVHPSMDVERARYSFAADIFTASIMQYLLLEKSELRTIAQMKPEIAEMYLNFLLLFMRTHQIRLKYFECHKHDDEYGYETLAFGCYPLINFLNHSCAANVESITLPDGRCAVLVVRPISIGGQLLLAYCEQNFLEHDRKERQTCMQMNYNFTCACEACVGDYPTWKIMFRAPVAAHYRAWFELETQYAELSNNTDKKKLSKAMACLRSQLKRASTYPNVTFCKRQSYLIRYYHMMYNKVSKNPNYWKYCNP